MTIFVHGKKVKVYIQIEDALLDVSGIIGSVTYTNTIDDRPYLFDENRHTEELDLHLVGCTGVWTTGNVIMQKATEYKSTHEWKCDYCGRPNLSWQQHCGQDKSCGCGAPRPFIYD